MSSKRRSLLIVVSAPSGGGKTTLCSRLLAEFRKTMVRSVSCTTRARRGDEMNGKEYHFIDEAAFAALLQKGEFMEHAVVHGYCYGTPRPFVEKMLAAGKDVLLAIDVQGARQIREQIAAAKDGSLLKRALVDVFVAPPSMPLLKKRLMARDEDSPETIKRRLKNAQAEMACMREFSYRVVNDELDAAFDDLRAIVKAERCRIMPA